MLSALTSVSIPHHHASGFDQVRKPDAERAEEVDGDLNGKAGRAGHSKLTKRSDARRKIYEGFMTVAAVPGAVLEDRSCVGSSRRSADPQGGVRRELIRRPLSLG
jgi:hypothetical protein